MKLLGSAKKDVALDKDGVDTEFSFIEVWFTDQNSGPLEIEDNVNLTLIIGLTL